MSFASTARLAALLIILSLLISSLAVQAADNLLASSYGAAANPTGNPIGGGADYSNVILGGNYTVSTSDELLAALKQAKTGEVIYVVPEAQIDLTGKSKIPIPAGVTLAGNRGYNGSPGPLISSSQYDTNPLFSAVGEGARITGLRIQGPDGEVFDSAYGRPNSEAIGASATIEVDNNEIYNWSYGGVAVANGAQDVYVHHNYIHHVQRTGLGYPVVVNSGTALIEANIFDYYRHAIAGTGYKGVGYEARYNVARAHSTSHVFDMHGGGDFCAKRSGPCSDEEWAMAGEYVIIHHNTFEAVDKNAIGVRGVPRQALEIYNNWFVTPVQSRGFRRVYHDGGNVHMYNNVYGSTKRLVEEELTPSLFVRKCVGGCNNNGPIVGFAGTDKKVKFGFINPPEGDNGANVNAVFPLEVAVDLAGEFTVDHFYVKLDNKLIYSGDTVPKPGEVMVDTLGLADGAHTLRIDALDPKGQRIQQSLQITVDNWWSSADPIKPPLTTGWFGVVNQDRTIEASSGWDYATENAEDFFGDGDRKVRTAATQEYLIWEAPAVREYKVTMFAKEKAAEGVKLSVSSDGSNWRDVEYAVTVKDPANVGGWAELQLSGSLPSDSKAGLFRLMLQENAPVDIQVGRVEFSGRKLSD